MSKTIQALQARLQAFAQARDWEQFHSPKNLTMALCVEAAELLEHFQWLSEEASQSLAPQQLEEVGFEMADIFIYMLRLAERLDIDLIDFVERKIEINENRYPADQVKGSSKKYDEY